MEATNLVNNDKKQIETQPVIDQNPVSPSEKDHEDNPKVIDPNTNVDSTSSQENHKDIHDDISEAKESGDGVKDASQTSVSTEEELTVTDTTKPDGQTDKGDEDNSIEDDCDGDPIPSGTGVVSKECSASDLIGWSEVLPKWHAKLNQRPRGLTQLVRNGIPDPLRGEVWQLLSGAQQCSDLMEQYRIFLTKSAPTEQIILRDVHRTYPAHENFRSGAGSSSLLDSLFKVCKAYAVYDEEVGYCQGLSFLVAALLLHMPEEQAFCVFVRIMQHYGLRDLFRNNFDELYLKFYQLEHLLEDQMPDIHQHFNLIGIEPFTYASQWFLTVFTAKFPLNAVFYIMDIFLLDGMNTIFQVALALLGSSRQELLSLDFEGVLKYFRVQMPKRYRNQEFVQQLIQTSADVNLKKLKKYAKAYEVLKQKEKLLEDPVNRLQRENAKLTENILRLEQENDDIARDLVASKIQLRAQLDLLEDKTETLNRALSYSRQDCQTYLSQISDIEDEKARLEVEVSQLKEVCRRELHRAETESARDTKIINDYKKICSSLSRRLDIQLEFARRFTETCRDLLKDNESCQDRKCYEVFCLEADRFIEQINSDTLSSPSDNQQPVASGDSPTTTTTTKTTTTSSQLNNNNNDNNNHTKNKLLRKISSESDPANRPVGAYLKSALDSESTSSETKIKQLTGHIDELEIELARTKLALVEAECKCQQLTHDLNVGVTVKTSSSTSTLGSLADASPDNHSSTSSTPNARGNKLQSMKTAMQTAKRSPTAGSTFSKLNSLISERISNIGGGGGAAGGATNTGSSSNRNYTNSMPL